MNRLALVVGGVLVLPLLAFLTVSLFLDPKALDTPLVGKPAPNFTLTDMNGRSLSLEELRGQPVVLNFWATWCVPCKYEHPVFLDGARRYQGKVRFVGILYQDDVDLARRYLHQYGAWGPTLIDADARVAVAYGVTGVPETFFIGADGVIHEKLALAVEANQLTTILDRLLEQHVPSAL